MEFEFHPVEIDRQLSRAHRSWLSSTLSAWQPTEDEDDPHPLAAYRSATGHTAFRYVSDLPESDALRPMLRRWVYRLAEQRINQPTLAALARERHREHRHPDTPGRLAISFASLLTSSLGDPPRREPWVRLYVQHAPPVSALAIDLWQRRRELARRMGLGNPGEIESPLADTASVAGTLAKTTSARLEELGTGTLAAFFERAIGADVPGDWPARLSPQRVSDYFREGDLIRSLSLEVAPLPATFGASSFCRALGLLGAAWFEALAPRDQPFVVAHDPYGLGRHTASALFALLPLNARYARRHLDVSGHALPDLQRRLAQLWLCDLALAALRVRLRGPALTSERAFRETFSEHVNHDLGVSLPETAAGAIFPLGIEDEQALLGKLLAVSRAQAMIDTHDEDWFRNPRAIEQLRAEASLPPVTAADPEQVARALQLTLKQLELFLR